MAKKAQDLKPDIVLKNYWRNNEQFADLFNAVLFQGPNEELVQDIISILHVFSCRIYGLRRYKNQIKEDEEIAKELQNGNPSNSGTKTEDKQNYRNLQIYL